MALALSRKGDVLGKVLKQFLVDWLGPMFYLVSPWKVALNSKDKVPKFLDKAMPMFILFAAIEAALGAWRRRRSPEEPRCPKYRLRDFVCSLSTGAFEESLQLMLSTFGVKLNVLLFALVHRRFAMVKYDVKKWPLLTFAGLMLGVDLGYYLCHRVNHEFHVMWAAHRVHHSGEDYNMATALRQSVPQRLTSPLFYLPLALVFNPAVFSAHQQLNTIFQFWIHTELIGWLGPLEYIFQTPAAHRMHHRIPGNCNYGGVFIFWDRIFGTYLCENEVGYWDNYGLAKSAETFSPLELHVGHWRKIALMPGSWLRRLSARRPVDTKWVFQPLNLFKPIPGPQPAPLKQPRRRYEGSEELSRREELLLVAAAAAAGAKFLSLSLSHEGKSRAAVLLGASSVAATIASVGRCMSEGTEAGQSVPVCVGLLAAAASTAM